MNNIQLSIIIAVYNRANELQELLQSLTLQTDSDFEVVIIDDGSSIDLNNVVQLSDNQLNVIYKFINNSGAAYARNYGMSQAKGNYFIFLDSDTIAPKNYIELVKLELKNNYTDAFGGPDAAHENFTILQKAISFSMTSFITTGGIRGGEKQVGRFQPRSFNMGISKEAFIKTGGFSNLKIGEDPDLSMTLWENGFTTRLFPKAFVYHKRRTSLKKFAKQVYQFGIARPILNQRHPKYVKATFWFPLFFTIGFLIALLLALISLFTTSALIIPIYLYLFYFVLVFIKSTLQFSSIKVGVYSILTTLIQFVCYGTGFLEAQIKLNILGQPPIKAFKRFFNLKNED